jgi:transcriptional regulator with XRE-family HTH domain
MQQTAFPVIDPVATGRKILHLRTRRGLSVRDLQAWFGFEEPQAIYKWQSGKSLPSVDNLYALSALLEVPMDEILVSARPGRRSAKHGQQAEACCPLPFAGRPGCSKSPKLIGSFLPSASGGCQRRPPHRRRRIAARRRAYTSICMPCCGSY